MPIGRSTAKTHILGAAAEDAVCAFLKQNGLIIVAQNFHCPYGEIDIVAQQNNTLLFVEVKYRRKSHYGNGLDAVNSVKQAKLIKAAQVFLMQHAQYDCYECRFDVVDVSLHLNEWQFNWLENAFML